MKPPVHLLSALVTLLLDWLWTIFELPATMTGVGLIFTSLALGLLCAVIVCLVQRYVDHDDWGAAAAKGLALGVAAGVVPYPVVGTAVGAPLLAWSGLKALGDKGSAVVKAE